jgi:hypothetical protein
MLNYSQVFFGNNENLSITNHEYKSFIRRLVLLQDAGSQQVGFLLGSCTVQVALTSEACLKGLPKTATGEVVGFKGWPKLTWFVTEHLGKTPKDFSPSARVTDETSAYIEVSSLPKVSSSSRKHTLHQYANNMGRNMESEAVYQFKLASCL